MTSVGLTRSQSVNCIVYNVCGKKTKILPIPQEQQADVIVNVRTDAD